MITPAFPTASRRARACLQATAAILIVATWAACSSTMSPYSPQAYEQATALKVEALTLMDAAHEPFAQHEEAVRALQTELRKAHEFARGRPKNEISTRQWALLIDSDRNLLGGFLKRWEDDETLAPAFVEEAQRLVADAFDTIIGLESGKIKPDDVDGSSI